MHAFSSIVLNKGVQSTFQTLKSPMKECHFPSFNLQILHLSFLKKSSITPHPSENMLTISCAREGGDAIAPRGAQGAGGRSPETGLRLQVRRGGGLRREVETWSITNVSHDVENLLKIVVEMDEDKVNLRF